ncbi:hypothetical protein HQ571_03260, partial [Candidatus Kuenenbacteria bacterium]|nr:hypothetical protein [Candidatus Kuenenbacteria bacterium]
MTTGADAKLKCPKCQTEMRIVETVCPKCGATGDDLKPPVGSNEIELPKVEDVLCQKCNTLTPEDNMLCKHCGANWNALDGAAQKDETPAPVVDPAAEEAKKLEDLQKAVAAVL